jgi:hypothetical protein
MPVYYMHYNIRSFTSGDTLNIKQRFCEYRRQRRAVILPLALPVYVVGAAAFGGERGADILGTEYQRPGGILRDTVGDPLVDGTLEGRGLGLMLPSKRREGKVG